MDIALYISWSSGSKLENRSLHFYRVVTNEIWGVPPTILAQKCPPKSDYKTTPKRLWQVLDCGKFLCLCATRLMPNEDS